MTLPQLTRERRNLTAQQYVLETVRTAILDGTLTIGSRLVQADLADQLNVSITPVREALRDLAAQGLVELNPNRGTVVRSLGLSEVLEIYELRMILEPLMVRRVIGRVSVADFARARDLHERMNTTDRLGEWVELNYEFHSIFSEGQSSSRLAAILEQLRSSAVHFVRLSLAADPLRITSANVEHARLIELYETNDVEAAIALTITHLQETVDAIEATQATSRG